MIEGSIELIPETFRFFVGRDVRVVCAMLGATHEVNVQTHKPCTKNGSLGYEVSILIQ